MSDQFTSAQDKSSNLTTPANWIDLVRQHAGSLKFGTVLITVQDSRVVQVDKSEKVRFDGASRMPAPTVLSRSQPNR